MESGNFKDNCQPVVRYNNCVFPDRAYQNSIELFVPIVHALRNNLAVSRNILRKLQPPKRPIEADYGSDTAKQEFFIRL